MKKASGINLLDAFYHYKRYMLKYEIFACSIYIEDKKARTDHWVSASFFMKEIM